MVVIVGKLIHTVSKVLYFSCLVVVQVMLCTFQRFVSKYGKYLVLLT